MKIKTSELEGKALDWAVEFAKGTCWVNGYFCYEKGDPDFPYPFTKKTRAYSTEWAQGMPIIDRERILISPNVIDRRFSAYLSTATKNELMHGGIYSGPTYLIAAMRCYVASKLGAEVDVPEKLV